MKFINSGIEGEKRVLILTSPQLSAIDNVNIKFEDLKDFSQLSKLADADIIDIAVTQYSAGVKLDVTTPRSPFKLPVDAPVTALINNAIGKTNRYEAIASFKDYTEFYVKSFEGGMVLGLARDINSLPETMRMELTGWKRIEEPNFGTALLAALYHVYGYEQVHFNDAVTSLPADGFTLSHVYKLLG